MHSPDEFQLDIVRLRELFDKAPFSDYEAQKQVILEKWRPRGRGASKREPSLSGLYASRVREKVNSSVYTPPELARLLFERTPWQATDSILDCSGGTGDLAAPFVQAGASVQLMDRDVTALAIAEMEHPGVRVCTGDFLEAAGRYDVIIGNPPYEGHKGMSPAEKERVKSLFPHVMGDKADLHFAFFAKAWELLPEGGILSLLVSRYWLEADSGQDLRRFVLNHFRILYLHDWYGSRPFGAGVDPILIVLAKGQAAVPYDIPVWREDVGEFVISSDALSSDSMKLLTRQERIMRRILEQECAMTLGQAGEFYQGIITGFDKAFVLTPKEAAAWRIEDELLVDWIKSTDLRGIRRINRLIYADAAAGDCPNFMRYIEQHRERLSGRREVKKGMIRFYQLQWGRDRALFESRRVLFPYKGAGSLFVPSQNVFHSADIYSYRTEIDLEWLCRLLNSPLYDAYIKTELKKLGGELYEYYPHRLKRICIPDPVNVPDPDQFIAHIQQRLTQELGPESDKS